MATQPGSERTYRALWPLPGGQGKFFVTLMDVLHWVENTGYPTESAIIDWFWRKYRLKPEGKAKGRYIRLIELDYHEGIFDPMTADTLYRTLARQHLPTRYARDEIAAALELLSSPLVGALRRVNDTEFILQMPIATLERRFRAQAQRLIDSVRALDGTESRLR